MCMRVCMHAHVRVQRHKWEHVHGFQKLGLSVVLHSIYWGRVSSLNPELYTSSQSTKPPCFRDLSVPPQVWGYRSCNHVHGHLCEFWGSQHWSSRLHGRCILQRHSLFPPSFFLFRTHLPNEVRFLVHFIKKKNYLSLHTVVCFIHSHDQQLTHPSFWVSKENITLTLVSYMWLCIWKYT